MKKIKPYLSLILIVLLPFLFLSCSDRVILVTFINKAGLEVMRGSVDVCGESIKIERMPQYESKMVPFKNCGGDTGFLVEIEFEDGSKHSEGLGYLGDSGGHIKGYVVEIYKEKFITTSTFIHTNRTQISKVHEKSSVPQNV